MSHKGNFQAIIRGAQLGPSRVVPKEEQLSETLNSLYYPLPPFLSSQVGLRLLGARRYLQVDNNRYRTPFT